MKLKSENNIFLFGYQYYTNDFHKYPNLCPLFWLGTLGLILFIATPFVNLFSFIKSLVKKDTFKETVYYEDLRGFQRFFIQLFIGFFYFSMVMLIWEGDGNLYDIPTWIWLYGWLIPLGILILIIGTTLLLVAGIGAIKDSENVEVFKEGVSTKFTKMCPRIDWIINDDTDTNE